MTYVQTIEGDEFRIILAFEFKRHADPARVTAFKQELMACQNMVHCVECTGDFELMLEISAPSLGWYNEWLKTLAKPLSKIVKACKTSYVCRRFIRRRSDDNALWVPSASGLKRIDERFIDKVTAEGDYVRVHAGTESWLIHATLRSVAEQLSRGDFVQIHRSLIVRRSFIQELRRDNNHWMVALGDNTVERVAKSHVSETLQTRQFGDGIGKLVENSAARRQPTRRLTKIEC